MILPIVKIPKSIAQGLAIYRPLFPRRESYEHKEQYCTGLVVLERPSIQRLSQCLVEGPSQSALNKAITESPWSACAMNQKRLQSMTPFHHNGVTIGIVDSTFIHHPRGQNIYGVYPYWDYVENRYTFAIQLVTGAISTNDRLEANDYRIYHRSDEAQEPCDLQHTALDDSETDQAVWGKRLIEAVCFERSRRQAKTKSQLAVELIDDMEASSVAPQAKAVDSGLFTPAVIERIERALKPWVADSEKNRIWYDKGERYHCETFDATLSAADENRSPFVCVTRSEPAGSSSVWFTFVALLWYG
ncbi:transposase [Candidatus Poribacteria bacterium]|nr:transposase [Candidatus Poribacteria bacterium]